MAHRAHAAFAFEALGISVPGVPEIASVGFNRWTPRRPHELGGHAHADQWEIHYLLAGRIVEQVAGETFEMHGGDVFIAAPGVEHTGINRVRHRCALCWLGVHLPARGALPGLSSAQTRTIRGRFAERGAAPFRADVALMPAFAGLLHEATRPSAVQALLCRALLHQILGLVTRPASAPAPTATPRSPAVAAAVALLEARLDFPLRIASLPAQVGLRRSALNQRFLAEMGVTATEYRMQRRLEAAKALLLAHGNAEVASRLGFATSQHLVNMFRRAYGVTPGAWRRRAVAATPPPAPRR